MVKRAPRTDSDGETGVDDEDPSKFKSWQQMDAELGITNTDNPPAESSGAAAAEGDEQPVATAPKSKKIREARPQIVVTPDVIEWVDSLISQGAALPKDATTEEKLTYQYKLNQKMKRLSKLQKSLRTEEPVGEILVDEDEEEDHGAQERPTGKHRSRDRKSVV